MMNSRFPTKIAILLRDVLHTWQRLNVTAFLAGSIAGSLPDLIGEDYVDADGVRYFPMFGQPVMVFEGDRDVLRSAHGNALARGMGMAIFTAELFETGNDVDNRDAVHKVPTEGRSRRPGGSRSAQCRRQMPPGCCVTSLMRPAALSVPSGTMVRMLSRRELNRALLARQGLLEPLADPLPRVLEQVGGIQAQYAPSMYIGLWSRMRSFERADLTEALESAAAVQATLLRGTIHLVSRAD
jgi:hypothetical protein